MRERVFGGEEYSEGGPQKQVGHGGPTLFSRRKWGVPGKVFQPRKNLAWGSGRRLGCERTERRENGASAAVLGVEDDLPHSGREKEWPVMSWDLRPHLGRERRPHLKPRRGMRPFGAREL